MDELLEAIIGDDDDGDNGACNNLNLPVDALFRHLNVTRHAEASGEGFLHLTTMESVERFWSFDAAQITKYIRGARFKISFSASNCFYSVC